MRIDAITIFPGYLAPLSESLLGKARERGLVDLRVHDLRTWTDDVHRTVDDTPYGGGPGMVMRPEPWGAALGEIAPPGSAPPRLVIPTPAGRLFTQSQAEDYAREPWLIFACGRYEGIDARVVEAARERMPVDEVSVGDFVLAGGEVAVLVMVEAVTRLLAGVVGNAESVADDSFAAGLLEGPSYTRPETWAGRSVPEVLLSGDHRKIARWRRDQALQRTAARRPDLLRLLPAEALSADDRAALADAGYPPTEPGTDG
ncbi:MAG: tRNA (guanosine(37)-N1)-methyltransferase TrmD [Mycobacteriales bacterium]